METPNFAINENEATYPDCGHPRVQGRSRCPNCYFESGNKLSASRPKRTASHVKKIVTEESEQLSFEGPGSPNWEALREHLENKETKNTKH